MHKIKTICKWSSLWPLRVGAVEWVETISERRPRMERRFSGLYIRDDYILYAIYRYYKHIYVYRYMEIFVANTNEKIFGELLFCSNTFRNYNLYLIYELQFNSSYVLKYEKSVRWNDWSTLQCNFWNICNENNVYHMHGVLQYVSGVVFYWVR